MWSPPKMLFRFRVQLTQWFANLFDDRTQIKTMFVDRVESLKDIHLDQLAGLKQAWREAEAQVTRGIKR